LESGSDIADEIQQLEFSFSGAPPDTGELDARWAPLTVYPCVAHHAPAKIAEDLAEMRRLRGYRHTRGFRVSVEEHFARRVLRPQLDVRVKPEIVSF